MKKLLRILVIILMVFAFSCVIKCYYNKNHAQVNLKIMDNKLAFNLKYKDLKNAVDFTSDGNGDYYIAYKSKIQFIDKNGRSSIIIKNNDFDISSIDYRGKKLYYSSRNKIYCYDLIQNKNSKLFSNIPNYGDYNRSIIRTNGNCLYISVGAVTNSGVVGNDNLWRNEKPYVHDITPKDIILKGINFKDGKTGAFQSYGTRSVKGQIISAHFPGNSSIVVYDIENKKGSTFAWGIRNVTGMDFNDKNELICSVGGMENRGSRAILGDNDYIYKIKKGAWYGWPDYSGGDPIISPKFKGNGNLSFLIENHPNMNPPSPLYQSSKVSSLGTIGIDTSGDIGEKNCIFFYNKRDNSLYSFKYPQIEKKKIEFYKNSLINSMKIYNGNLLILDSKSGYLYSITKDNKNIIINSRQYNNIYIYLIISAVVVIVLILKIKRD